MSTIFYDKENIKFDNQLQDINGRINRIQESFPEERAYLDRGAKIYEKHHTEVKKRIASILREENKWTNLAAFVGGTVGALAIWELIRDVRWILKWIGDKMAKQEKDSADSQRRLHARDWNY